jgi:hypothetical protein
MKAIFLLALALSCAIFSGCGGGSNEGGGDVTRELLSGTGTKTWKLVAIAGNHNYPRSGADQPCPLTMRSLVDDGQTLECGESDLVTINSDGTFKFDGFGKTWSLDGTKITLDYGSALGVQVAEIVPQTVGGKQRLRVLQISLTRKGALQPHDDGAVLVLEEVLAM